MQPKTCRSEPGAEASAENEQGQHEDHAPKSYAPSSTRTGTTDAEERSKSRRLLQSFAQNIFNGFLHNQAAFE